jgi:hypothetical protein
LSIVRVAPSVGDSARLLNSMLDSSERPKSARET